MPTPGRSEGVDRPMSGRPLPVCKDTSVSAARRKPRAVPSPVAMVAHAVVLTTTTDVGDAGYLGGVTAR